MFALCTWCFCAFVPFVVFFFAIPFFPFVQGVKNRDGVGGYLSKKNLNALNKFILIFDNDSLLFTWTHHYQFFIEHLRLPTFFFKVNGDIFIYIVLTYNIIVKLYFLSIYSFRSLL